MRSYLSILLRGIKRYTAYPHRLMSSLILSLIFVILISNLWSHLLDENGILLAQYFIISGYIVPRRLPPYISNKYSNSVRLGWDPFFLKPIRLSAAVFSEVSGYTLIETLIHISVGYGLLLLTGFVPSLHTILLLPLILLLINLYDFVIEYIISGFSFFIYEVWGLNVVYGNIFFALSGGLVPLSVFPEWARAVLDYLPFPFRRYYMIQFLMTGELIYLVKGSVMLILWSMVLGLLGYLIHSIGWKRFESQGG